MHPLLGYKTLIILLLRSFIRIEFLEFWIV